MAALVLLAIVWLVGGSAWLLHVRRERRDDLARLRFRSAIEILGGFSDPPAKGVLAASSPARTARSHVRRSSRVRRRILTVVTQAAAAATVVWAGIAPSRGAGTAAVAAVLVAVIYQQLAIATSASRRRRRGSGAQRDDRSLREGSH